MGKMYDILDEALSEALEYVQGNVKLRTKEIFIPDSPKHYRGQEIKKLRSKLGITQKDLALWLNVSLNTVQAWEQNIRNPSHSSLRLLEIFNKDFSIIEKILKNKKQTSSLKKTAVPSSSAPHRTCMVAKSKN